MINKNEISMEYINTSEKVTAIMTKPLCQKSIKKHKSIKMRIGLARKNLVQEVVLTISELQPFISLHLTHNKPILAIADTDKRKQQSFNKVETRIQLEKVDQY